MHILVLVLRQLFHSSETQPDHIINSKMWLFRYVLSLKNIYNK